MHAHIWKIQTIYDTFANTQPVIKYNRQCFRQEHYLSFVNMLFNLFCNSSLVLLIKVVPVAVTAPGNWKQYLKDMPAYLKH